MRRRAVAPPCGPGALMADRLAGRAKLLATLIRAQIATELDAEAADDAARAARMAVVARRSDADGRPLGAKVNRECERWLENRAATMRAAARIVRLGR